jgi:osmotically inducible protein OsmC
MPVRKANAVWTGDFASGKGIVKVESGLFEGPYDAKSRFEAGTTTNPEELIGAAHAGCYSMALSAALGKNGFKPEKIETDADVQIEKVGEGWKITKIHLTTKAKIPGIDADKFAEFADGAKKGCPVSQALAGPEITLDATLT